MTNNTHHDAPGAVAGTQRGDRSLSPNSRRREPEALDGIERGLGGEGEGQPCTHPIRQPNQAEQAATAAAEEVRERGERSPGPGTVYLVGAGPGDPGLITVAGLEALRAADVIVYDRLAAPALLGEARADATLIDAGKAPGVHRIGQDGINALLAEHALAGRTVVRLKGGDPFVFGRGGEEAIYLRERGLPVRVVPGVTSAVAAPAYAGIPVTQRGVAGSVLIATGHEAADGDGMAHDWAAMARAADTLVFLMGVERIDIIAAGLLAGGRPPDQPAALVRWGSTPEQSVLTATLGTVAEAAREAAIRPPAVLVVGEVVRLRDRLSWFEELPLFGARVLVTRASGRASGLSARLRALGALPVELPTIAHHPVDHPAELDTAIATLREGWAVFTSRVGVEAVWERLARAGRDARALAPIHVCAVGPATAAALVERGITADLVPETASNAGVVDALRAAGVAGKAVTVFQAAIAPPNLCDGLRFAGARVQRVTAYHTVPAGKSGAEIRRLLADGINIVTFTSSSTVTHLLDALGGDGTPLDGALIVSIGPTTSATARTCGLRVDAEAAEHTLDGLVEAAIQVWQRRTQHENIEERTLSSNAGISDT